jgi:chloramphenicol O-acetyltransferase type B
MISSYVYNVPLVRYLYDIVKYFDYKRLYPNSHVALGSRIWNGSTVGHGTRIGRNSSISGSIIADNVTVSGNCRILSSTIGENAFVYPGCSMNNVKLGRFSYVGVQSSVHMTTIGSFCSVGHYFLCGFGEHPTRFVSTSPLFYSTLKQCGVSFTDRDFFQEREEISIGHDVWIGVRVFIRDGVKIGNGAIVAAGSVVVEDVQDYAIVGGVPAKVVRFRFPPEMIKQLLEIEWWNWSSDRLRKAQPIFAQDDVNAFLEWARRESGDGFISNEINNKKNC